MMLKWYSMVVTRLTVRCGPATARQSYLGSTPTKKEFKYKGLVNLY